MIRMFVSLKHSIHCTYGLRLSPSPIKYLNRKGIETLVKKVKTPVFNASDSSWCWIYHIFISLQMLEQQLNETRVRKQMEISEIDGKLYEQYEAKMQQSLNVSGW